MMRTYLMQYLMDSTANYLFGEINALGRYK